MVRPQESAADKAKEWVDLQEFSRMVGHPLELIQKELFLSEKECPGEKVHISHLREAMAKLLHRTIG